MAAAHVALVEHSFCAEHERLEEGAEVHLPGTDEAHSHASETAAVSPGHPEDLQAEHEGCAFGESFTLEDCFVLPVDLAAEPALAIESPQVLRSGTLAESLPILRVAPKSSPPSVA